VTGQEGLESQQQRVKLLGMTVCHYQTLAVIDTYTRYECMDNPDDDDVINVYEMLHANQTEAEGYIKDPFSDDTEMC
jgi:hypothetical protein